MIIHWGCDERTINVLSTYNDCTMNLQSVHSKKVVPVLISVPWGYRWGTMTVPWLCSDCTISAVVPRGHREGTVNQYSTSKVIFSGGRGEGVRGLTFSSWDLFLPLILLEVMVIIGHHHGVPLCQVRVPPHMCGTTKSFTTSHGILILFYLFIIYSCVLYVSSCLILKVHHLFLSSSFFVWFE